MPSLQSVLTGSLLAALGYLALVCAAATVAALRAGGRREDVPDSDETLAASHLTMRTSRGSCVRGAMKSMSVTTPVAVSNLVSRMSVSGRYRRVVRAISPAGASCQRPFSGVPSSAAKQAPESKRGRHNQSIDPSRPTSAAE